LGVKQKPTIDIEKIIREKSTMGTKNLVFLENLEWFDETGKELVHRLPEKGSGEIKYGAQLTVRESQAGIFFYQGKAIEAFGPGRHTLKTLNIPILGAYQPSARRDVFCKSEDIYEPQVGNKGSCSFQRFRTRSDTAQSIWGF
jgi:membrane protease subunit (stomatin/prohibitin family)